MSMIRLFYCINNFVSQVYEQANRGEENGMNTETFLRSLAAPIMAFVLALNFISNKHLVNRELEMQITLA